MVPKEETKNIYIHIMIKLERRANTRAMVNLVGHLIYEYVSIGKFLNGLVIQGQQCFFAGFTVLQ